MQFTASCVSNYVERFSLSTGNCECRHHSLANERVYFNVAAILVERLRVKRGPGEPLFFGEVFIDDECILKFWRQFVDVNLKAVIIVTNQLASGFSSKPLP